MTSKKGYILIFILILGFKFINIAKSIEPDVFVQSTVNRASKLFKKYSSKRLE